jgi:hypothetical protein
MGRAFFIKHRTSHLTIGVTDEVNAAARVAAPRRRGVGAKRKSTKGKD